MCFCSFDFIPCLLTFEVHTGETSDDKQSVVRKTVT